MRRALQLLALAALVVTVSARAQAAEAAAPSVDVPGPGATVRVDAAAGELENGSVIVRGVSGRLSVRLDEGSAPLLQQGLSVLRLTDTQVAGRAIGDPLPPLAQRSKVSASSPVTLVLRFRVPDATPAGIYEGRLDFARNGHGFASVPVRLRVFGVQMPARDDPTAFRTLFLIQPQTYLAAVLARSGIEPQSGRAGRHRPPLRLPLRLPRESR